MFVLAMLWMYRDTAQAHLNADPSNFEVLAPPHRDPESTDSRGFKI
jgi:hypothetical protein